MLDTLKHIICLEEKEGNGTAAFNVFGYEDARAVINAAESLNRPVILMTNKPALKHMPVRILGRMLLEMADSASVPVGVHLDHADDLAVIQDALETGYTSVMIDASLLPFEENITRTKNAVSMARYYGASVEAEIGCVGYSDSPSKTLSIFTQPGEAREFALRTEVDALAISIGTVHRMETQTANLQFDLLERIHGNVDIPLVIHGSSGIADKDLKKLVKCGARKINMGTTLRIAFGKELRRQIQCNEQLFDRIQMYPACMEAVQEKARQKMMLLGTEFF